MAYTTNKSLLNAIQRGDEVSWNRFYETYRPLIVHIGQSSLNPNEIDDLVQTVVLRVFQSRSRFRYDPAKGKFRNWLGSIVRNSVTDILRKRKPEEASASLPESEEDSFERKWNEEWRKHLLSQAVEILKTKVSARTFQAFDFYVLQEMKPEKTAEFLGIEISKVYKAKFKCTSLLKDIVTALRKEDNQ